MSTLVPSLRLSDRSVEYAAIAGLGHLLLVVAVSAWLGFSLRTFQGGLEGTLLLVAILVGAVLMGAVPAVLFSEKRLVTPALVVAALFAWSVYGSWRLVFGPSSHLTPVGPTPFGWYSLAWFVVLAVALAAGVLEVAVRLVRARLQPRTG